MSLILPALVAGLVGTPPPPLVLPKPAIIRPAPDLGILPGFPVMSGGLPPKEISFVGYSTSTGPSITLPAEIEDGDYVIVSDFEQEWLADGVTGNWLRPSLAPSMLSTSNGNYKLMIYTKIATSEDAGNTIVGEQTYNEGPGKIALAFRKTRGEWGTFQNIDNVGTQGNPSPIDVGGSAFPSVVVAHYCSSAAISPASFSPAEDGSASNTTRHVVKYLIQNTAAATVTVDMDDEGDANLMAAYRFTLS